jgi:hypothetical protein
MENSNKTATPFEWHHLQALLTRPIAFHPIFAKIAGGAVPGIFLSQAYYWTCVLDATEPNREGWFYKTGRDWHSETLLTRREQESARKALRNLNLLEEKNAGIPSRKYYRLNKNALLAALDAYLPTGPSHFGQTSLHVSRKQVCTERANKSAQNAPTLKGTKTTALTTTVSRAQIETLLANLSDEQSQAFDDKVNAFISSPAGRAMLQNTNREEVEIHVMKMWIQDAN